MPTHQQQSEMPIRARNWNVGQWRPTGRQPQEKRQSAMQVALEFGNSIAGSWRTTARCARAASPPTSAASPVVFPEHVKEVRIPGSEIPVVPQSLLTELP